VASQLIPHVRNYVESSKSVDRLLTPREMCRMTLNQYFNGQGHDTYPTNVSSVTNGQPQAPQTLSCNKDKFQSQTVKWAREIPADKRSL